MITLAKKTKHFSLFILRLILGIVMMAGVVIGLPVVLLSYDSSMFADMTFSVIILAIMLVFCLVGYFLFLRPYLLYRKLPEVQAETDGDYLYIHSTKEAKIPLVGMGGVVIDYDIPLLTSKEYIVHSLSEQYGDLVIDIPEYGTYKLYFVCEAERVANTIVNLVDEKIDAQNNL